MLRIQWRRPHPHGRPKHVQMLQPAKTPVCLHGQIWLQVTYHYCSASFTLGRENLKRQLYSFLTSAQASLKLQDSSPKKCLLDLFEMWQSHHPKRWITKKERLREFWRERTVNPLKCYITKYYWAWTPHSWLDFNHAHNFLFLKWIKTSIGEMS